MQARLSTTKQRFQKAVAVNARGPALCFVSIALYGAMLSTSVAEPKPVPRMQAVPQPREQISFQRDGEELARLHFSPAQNRPFVFPVLGRSRRSLTRMGHPHDPESHSHHNSVWLAHQSVNRVSFWEDRSGAKIKHLRVLRLEDGPEEAFVETENGWTDKNGATVMHEFRRTAVQTLPNDEWLLLIDLQLEARSSAVTLGQTPFGLLGVRMAKTIGVHDGGGTIRNSEGAVDEAGCFRKPARWVDYSGAITPQATEGITLMDHPANLHHPVPFHVRNDGWMGAAVTFPGAHVITPGEPLRLRYALYVHAGIPEAARLEDRWQAFAKTAWRDFPQKR